MYSAATKPLSLRESIWPKGTISSLLILKTVLLVRGNKKLQFHSYLPLLLLVYGPTASESPGGWSQTRLSGLHHSTVKSGSENVCQEHCVFNKHTGEALTAPDLI